LAERRTITVHVLADARVHLALAYLGRLKQGRLETLCGKLAVTRLSPFAAAAAKASDRCKVCFGKVDDDGLLKAELVPPRKERAPKPEAEVIDLAAAREARETPAAQPAAVKADAAAEPAVKPAKRQAPGPKAVAVTLRLAGVHKGSAVNRSRTYAVVLEPEAEGGFTVRVPAFPEIVTCGENEREALVMAEDAIRLVIEDCTARREPIR
jgi:antitoxin HicB